MLAAVVLGCTAAAYSLQPAVAQSPNTLSPAETSAGWRLLFDGATSTGWHLYGGGRVVGWEIADGALVALAQDGGHDIVTDDEFENFELVIDWKLSPRANSGIFFNVVEQGNKAIYATGPEYQIIDDDGWPSRLEDWQRTGANYAMHPPLTRAAKPVGEWNRTRIVVDRGHVEHWLNGEKTADYVHVDGRVDEARLSRKVEGLSRLRARQKRQDRPAGPRQQGVVPQHQGAGGPSSRMKMLRQRISPPCVCN